MKTICSILLVFISALPFSPPVAAQSEAGEQAIRDLGALNGMALECGYIDQVRRMKKAIVAYAPKTRYYGSVFEESTNKGFMAFIEAKRPCPTEVTLEAKVEEAVSTLQKAFP